MQTTTVFLNQTFLRFFDIYLGVQGVEKIGEL